MNTNPITHINVAIHFNTNQSPLPVGQLTQQQRTIYFEYDKSFVERGLEISPLHCPLRQGVQQFDRTLFDGLPGVFNDSLPDGWGRLLLDRQARTHNLAPEQLTPLDRLAHVGQSGMGALLYQPSYEHTTENHPLNLDKLATEAKSVLAGHASDVLDELIALNGSSAGARPKAMIHVSKDLQTILHQTNTQPDDFTAWIVKFPNIQDGEDAGAIEYVYSVMAKQAGITMPDTHLFPAKSNPGYFAAERFDQHLNQRLHLHSVCGLLHTDFRIPTLDYTDLLTLTTLLTKQPTHSENMFRLAVFNVLAHNRDDHAKNFSFSMQANGQWQLSPAYDLTFSFGPGGEHSTTVKGQGKDITIDQLIQLGVSAQLNSNTIKTIIEQTQQALAQWPLLAKQHGVSQDNIDFIEKKHNTAKI